MKLQFTEEAHAHYQKRLVIRGDRKTWRCVLAQYDDNWFLYIDFFAFLGRWAESMKDVSEKDARTNALARLERLLVAVGYLPEGETNETHKTTASFV